MLASNPQRNCGDRVWCPSFQIYDPWRTWNFLALASMSNRGRRVNGSFVECQKTGCHFEKSDSNTCSHVFSRTMCMHPDILKFVYMIWLCMETKDPYLGTKTYVQQLITLYFTTYSADHCWSERTAQEWEFCTSKDFAAEITLLLDEPWWSWRVQWPNHKSVHLSYSVKSCAQNEHQNQQWEDRYELPVKSDSMLTLWDSDPRKCKDCRGTTAVIMQASRPGMVEIELSV